MRENRWPGSQPGPACGSWTFSPTLCLSQPDTARPWALGPDDSLQLLFLQLEEAAASGQRLASSSLPTASSE